MIFASNVSETLSLHNSKTEEEKLQEKPSLYIYQILDFSQKIRKKKKQPKPPMRS